MTVQEQRFSVLSTFINGFVRTRECKLSCHALCSVHTLLYCVGLCLIIQTFSLLHSISVFNVYVVLKLHSEWIFPVQAFNRCDRPMFTELFLVHNSSVLVWRMTNDNVLIRFTTAITLYLTSIPIGHWSLFREGQNNKEFEM